VKASGVLGLAELAMTPLSLTRTLCITSALVLASCGEAKVAAKIKPEEVEFAGTIVSRSIKGCAKEGWEVCLFLTKIFFPEAAEIGGKVPRAGQRFEQFCDTNPGLRQEWSMVDRGCSYRPYSGWQNMGR
jgi:hypothetical protein